MSTDLRGQMLALSALVALTCLTTASPALADLYDVTAYGADGSDQTDDGSDIQDAIDAAEAAGGGTVYFPEGTYIISSALTIEADGIHLRGDGWSSIIDSTGNALSVAGYDEILIRDLEIKSSGTTGSAMLFTGNCQNILVENVHMKGFAKTLKMVPSGTDRCEDVVFRDVWVEDGNSWGIEISNTERILFDNVRSTLHGNDGLKIGEGTTHWRIQGGRFEGNGADGVDTKNAGSPWSIEGTVFLDNTGAGLRLQTDSDSAIYEGSIVGITADSNGGSGLDLQVGTNDYMIHHISVQGGLFARNGDQGIRIFGARNLALVGVIVKENDDDGILIEDDCFDIDIVAPQISANSQATSGDRSGIEIRGDRVRVLGGHVNATNDDESANPPGPPGDTKFHKYNIHVTSAASDTLISGTVLRHGATGNLQDDGTSTTQTNVTTE